MANKLNRLDVVRTKFGTVAVVAEVSGGEASLAFAKDTAQKIAWYSPDELIVIGNVIDLTKEMVK
jgi:hypothetical protein